MEKLRMQSASVTQENIEKIRSLFPHCVTEVRDENGDLAYKMDFEQLRQELSEHIVEGEKERYGLNWAGKKEAILAANSSVAQTLRPVRGESVNFDETKNLFIEGDNLAALKLLRDSYFEKIKMIYIDPPYNTGKDFIYKDNFAEKKEDYLERTEQKDDNSNRLVANTESNGRFHSDWLSMMYSRLKLAKHLLREDGVIFISIDDNEQANLKALCDDMFGEENFEGNIHWRRRHNQPNDPTKMLALVAEHILVYSKNKQSLKEVGVGKIGLTGTFKNPDNDPRGSWASKPWKVGSDQSGSRYIIKTPTGVEYDEEWMGDESTYESLLGDNRIIFPNKGNGTPRKKYFESERREEGQSATNWWSHSEFGHNQEGNEEMKNLFGIKNIFSNPKPKKLLNGLSQISNAKENDIILDFFAGSCTTAHAVMQLNAEDGGKRQFIMVQLPELCDEKSEAHKAGYRTIADIGRERIRRAAKKIKKDNPHYKGDLGFKSFTLAPSNFKVWESDMEKITDLDQQLLDHIDHVDPASSPEDILYELLLNAGFPLTATINKVTMAQKEVFSINNGAILICLDETITADVIDAMAAANPQQVICLDKAFHGNDQLKVNAVQTFKSRAQQNESEIVFRTV